MKRFRLWWPKGDSSSSDNGGQPANWLGIELDKETNDPEAQGKLEWWATFGWVIGTWLVVGLVAVAILQW
ncbi:hypothetical protein [Dongshaea marina]|uniref:hypothetical protein n=1 Tax=Dongshaea marina TaxID=2047966 RepID=UPI000D3E606C|nr:hypothetical protein [Dongshaea marina]